MAGNILGYSKKITLSLLILLSFSSNALLSQKILSGNLNQPSTHVVTIAADRVTVDDVTGFSPGDTILLIQMQGVKVLLSPYGSIQDKFGEPGMHEFLIISAINGGNEIVFSRNILASYDPNGNIQIVRVPYYNSATVTGSALYCDEWDPVSKSGGVLAIIIGRRLKLEADIDLSGRGFKGAVDAIGGGLCLESYTGEDYYPLTFTNAGLKGEGVANYTEFNQPLLPDYAKGLGPNWTGGGGGDGRFSGGGGGSNRGIGGQGGIEDNIYCPAPFPGGLGGFVADHPTLLNRIYMGGGGGASTSFTGLSQPAGNGGGIVIIVTDTIIGNGGKIISNGNDGGLAVVDGGSGGGGAGGSIALSLNSYGSAPLEFSVTGGHGGDNPGTFGEGGGGGGGLLYVSTNTTGNVTNLINGGLAGNYPSSAFSGGNGEIRSGFKAVLNGFLFNSIRSSVTLNQVDSICSNVIIPKITGTIPVGGTPPYSYLWEKSYDEVSWTTLTNDADPTNYTPSVLETDTVYFRRTITDSSIPTVLVDVSKTVKIIVQTAIADNLVGKDTTICYNQNPLSLIPLTAGPLNGNGSYAYRWIENNTNTNWITSPDASGINDNPDYDPPVLTDTTYYQRIVTSGRCIDYSPTVTITVLPLITGNITTRPDSVICEGSLFNSLGASAPGGGDMTFKYLWQDSINAGTWVPATGVNDGTTFSVDTSTFSVIENRYFRRVVYSGPDDVCRNNSSPIQLTRYHKIENNSILADQTIGWDSIPSPLIGSDPLFGDLTYTYVWESMINSQPWAPADVSPHTLKDYGPINLTDTTWYRRIVNSSVCSDTSNILVVNVHDQIIKNTVSFVSGFVEDTICSGSVPEILNGELPEGGSAIPGDYAYKWYSSLTGGPLQSEWSEITGSTAQNYQPGSLTQTTFFRREVGSPIASPTAISVSNSIKITVLPLISNSISGVDSVCYETQPLAFLESHSGGDNLYSFTWQDSTDATGWNDIAGYIYSSSPAYQPPNLLSESKYRRIVYSGSNDCCIDTSNVLNIGIHPLPTGTITSTTDTSICEGSDVSLRISLTGASAWNIIYNENLTPIAVNDITSPDITLLASPVTSTALTSYTYTLASIQDKNGCIATSLVGSRKADVYKVPVANAGVDADTCGPTYSLKAIPSVGTGTWYYPVAVLSSTGNSSSSTITIDSTFAGSNITHKFYWEEVNWQCKNRDSVEITFDKRVGAVNAGQDTALYSFDNVMHMTGDPLLEVGTGLWTVIDGTGDFEDVTSGQTKVRNLSKGNNKFLWTVTNGTCFSEDMVTIEVYELIIPEGFSPNNDPGNYNNEFIITGLDLPNQIAELKVVNGAGTEVYSTSNTDGQEWLAWDGKNSKGYDLPEGTYYYLLKITSKFNDQVFKKSGFIILKRY